MTTTERAHWGEIDEPVAVADALIDLYERRGDRTYDESVTQNEHARQVGAHAMASGAGPATIAAAFLHDVGHLRMAERRSDIGFVDFDRRHEEVGARFLANWFGDDVTIPVQMHVAAKRYLCAVDPGYHDGLSPASARSLVVQGGPMTEVEVTEYDADEHADAAVDLRRWDDLGKTPGAPTPPMAVYHDIIVEVLRVDA